MPFAIRPVYVCLWLAVAGTTTVLTGCDTGPRLVPVSGKVLIDGQPLTYGFIQVMPENERVATGTIGQDGTFTLSTYEDNDGAVLGKHKAAVIAVEALNAGSQKWHAPKMYTDAQTSGLTVDITGPTDALVLELTWDGGKPFIERSGGDENPSPSGE